MTTDEQLMLQVQQGQLECMSQLFARYHRRIYNFYFKDHFDEAFCKDLTQNVFERVLKYRGSYKPTYSFKSWIYQMARNVRVDNYRKRQESYPGADNLSFDKPDKGNAQVIMEEQEQNKLLHKALDSLKPENREIIWLSRFEKMKYAEIAALIGCSEGALKVKMYRAMKELKSNYFKLEEK